MARERTLVREEVALEMADTLVDEELYFSRLRIPPSGAPCGARLVASTPHGRVPVVLAHVDVDGAELVLGRPLDGRTRLDLPLPLPGVAGATEGRVVGCEQVDDGAWQVSVKFVAVDAERRHALVLVVKALKRLAPRL